MIKIILLVVLTSILCACGTAQVAVQIDNKYKANEDAKVVLGETKNETGNEYDIDISGLLENALGKQLQEIQRLSPLSEKGNIVIVSEIVEYEKGDAFKRWLWPGYGSTKLVVNSEIEDYQGNNIGSIKSKHTVDSGGAYTIGAWGKVFENVAEDIVKELVTKLDENRKS